MKLLLDTHTLFLLPSSFNPLHLTSCTIVKNRQDACSTRKFISCGTGILPVPKQVIEKGATSQLHPLHPWSESVAKLPSSYHR